jgi:environmental stress-induced protein Ves
VLVRGAGVELDFGQQGRARLQSVGQQVSFNGSWPTQCTLLDGPSTDLNLIVAQERIRSSSSVLHLTQPQIVQTSEWSETLVCCISGVVLLSDERDQSAELRGIETARCSSKDGAITCIPLGAAPVWIFVAGLSPRESDPEHRTGRAW